MYLCMFALLTLTTWWAYCLWWEMRTRVDLPLRLDMVPTAISQKSPRRGCQPDQQGAARMSPTLPHTFRTP